MDSDLDLDELVADWTLVDDEPFLAAKKQGVGRLAFALQLKVYGRHRFRSVVELLRDTRHDPVSCSQLVGTA